MNKVMQHHTPLLVIYAHQSPASWQGASLWVKQSCAKTCSINKSERILGLKTSFTGSLTPGSNKISFATSRSHPLSSIFTHVHKDMHTKPDTPQHTPRVCTKTSREQLCNNLWDPSASRDGSDTSQEEKLCLCSKEAQLLWQWHFSRSEPSLESNIPSWLTPAWRVSSSREAW